MQADVLEHYVKDGSRRGPAPDGAYSGAAGGAPCGDLVRVSLRVEGGRIAAAMAAGAAVAEAVEGEPVLAAARVGPEDVSDALGGLSPQGRHAADLAADALHRALAALVSSGALLVD